MRRSAEAWETRPFRWMATATVALIAAGSIVWMHQIRSVLAAEDPDGAPRAALPRLEGVMISETRRAALLNGCWLAEGGELSLDGASWRVQRIHAASALLTRGDVRRRVPLDRR